MNTTRQSEDYCRELAEKQSELANLNAKVDALSKEFEDLEKLISQKTVAAKRNPKIWKEVFDLKDRQSLVYNERYRIAFPRSDLVREIGELQDNCLAENTEPQNPKEAAALFFITGGYVLTSIEGPVLRRDQLPNKIDVIDLNKFIADGKLAA